MPPAQIFDAKLAAKERIALAAKQHPNDFRAQCRAAEVSFWSDWCRSHSDISERDLRYAQAAYACADAFHARPEKEQQH